MMRDQATPSVVHVLWSGGTGGIERLVFDLACRQSREGMRVAVAFGQATGPFADACRRTGISVLDLGLHSGLDLVPGRILAGARRLRDADLVHLHAFNLPFAALVMRARRPVVFTEHGSFCLGRRLRLRERPKRLAQRLFLRRFAAIAANSSYTRQRLCQLHRIDSREVPIVHNGVDFASITPPGTEGGGRPVLLAAYVGRLAGFKRVDRLIDALAQVPPQARLRVIVVGAGPLDEDLRRLAEERGLDGRIRFLGAREDLDEVLREADVLVHPSEGEPFGLAIVEACARGMLPVVFSDGGGALEVVPPDACVAGSVEELAAILVGLAGSDALSPSARCKRSAWAREAFPIARTADAYLDIYRSVIAASSAGRA